jgi:hypothetical protein
VDLGMKKIIVLALVITSILISSRSFCESTKNSLGQKVEFRRSLKGEIVFVRRDKTLNVYSILANGGNEKLLYRNNDAVNSHCFFPYWSEDGFHIYFTAMKDGKFKRWVMDRDGYNPHVVESLPALTISQSSREDDIIVKCDSIYIKDQDKPVYLDNSYDNGEIGLGEASWSPDKEYIIFQLWDDIIIVDKEGVRSVVITQGTAPHWKY